MKNFGHFITFFVIIQLVVFCYQPISAQKIKTEQVPDDVVQTLDYRNPGVKVLSWEMDGKNYAAVFKDGGIRGKIYISPAGVWLRTTYDVRINELPSTITDYVKQNYPEYVISVSCIEESENETSHYYIEAKVGGIGYEPSILTFDNNGKLLERNDPANFVDPLAQNTRVSAKNAEKETPDEETIDKSTLSEGTAKTGSSRSTVSKPDGNRDKTTSKHKKIKPEPVIKDENGNVALKPETIPAAVVKAFSKKIFHPEELHWFFIDSMYVAKCTNTGMKTAAYVTPRGVWVKTLIMLPEEAITGPMLKYLNDYYGGFKFKNAISEQRADKQNKTVVEFYEKCNYKSRLATTAIFDKSGRLLRTVEPDFGSGDETESAESEDLEKYYEKMNMGLSSDELVNVPENVATAFKLKYPRVTNVVWKEDELNYLAIYYDMRGKQICVINHYGTIVETMTLGKPGKLSVTIVNYLKKAHKGAKIVDYYTVKKIAERKSFYKVIVKNKKTQQESTLWFDTTGKPVSM